MDELQIVDPLRIFGWNDLIKDHSGTTVFHTSEWARVLSETYRYNPLYFVKLTGKRISTLLPLMEVKSFITGKRAVCLPFTDLIPPLYEKESDLKELINSAFSYGQDNGWKKVELRCSIPVFKKEHPSLIYLTHNLLLDSDKEKVISKFNQNVQRNIRKSALKGVSVQIDNSQDGIIKFHKLNQITRKRHGLPPQPLSFFKSVHQNIISTGLGNVLLGYYQNVCIAGAVFFHFRDHAIFKYGASDTRYHRLGPNNLVMWEAISNYCDFELYKTLNFGRTEPDNEGLRRFKMGWGCEESSVNYYTYDVSKALFVSGNGRVKDWHKKLFSKTPVPVLGLLGFFMYRHVG